MTRQLVAGKLANRNRANRMNRPAMFMGVLALIVAGVALVTAVIPFRQILDQRASVESAADELARINLENQLLSGEVAALNTPQGIERLARENLGYVMPGEIAYVVLEPDGSATSTPTAEQELETGVGSAAAEDVPWYQAIWNFFTGADLSANQAANQSANQSGG